jgi:hypothetical protein
MSVAFLEFPSWGGAGIYLIVIRGRMCPFMNEKANVSKVKWGCHCHVASGPRSMKGRSRILHLSGKKCESIYDL